MEYSNFPKFFESCKKIASSEEIQNNYRHSTNTTASFFEQKTSFYAFLMEDNYEMLENKGKGGFGEVVIAYNKTMAIYVALKTLQTTATNEIGFSRGDLMSQEFEILLRIKQLFSEKEQFVKFLNCYQTKDQKLVFEMEAGEINLLSILTVRNIKKKPYSPSNLLYIFTSLVRDLSMLEEIGISWGDAKPSNIVLVAKEGDNILEKVFYYKIIDFGAGMLLKPGQKSVDRSKIRAFTSHYASTEVLEKWKGGYYNPFKADVYSLGIVFLEIAEILRPNKSKINENRILAIKLRKYEEIEKKYQQNNIFFPIFSKMLIDDSESRSSFKEVLNYLESLSNELKELPPTDEIKMLEINGEREKPKERFSHNFELFLKFMKLTFYKKAGEHLKTMEKLFSNEGSSIWFDDDCKNKFLEANGLFYMLVSCNYKKSRDNFKQLLTNLETSFNGSFSKEIISCHLNIARTYFKEGYFKDAEQAIENIKNILSRHCKFVIICLKKIIQLRLAIFWICLETSI